MDSGGGSKNFETTKLQYDIFIVLDIFFNIYIFFFQKKRVEVNYNLAGRWKVYGGSSRLNIGV